MFVSVLKLKCAAHSTKTESELNPELKYKLDAVKVGERERERHRVREGEVL